MSEKEQTVTCTNCNGTGIIAYLPEPTGDDRVIEKVPDPCNYCGGSGKVTPGQDMDTLGSFYDAGSEEDERDDTCDICDELSEDCVCELEGMDDPDLDKAGEHA